MRILLSATFFYTAYYCLPVSVAVADTQSEKINAVISAAKQGDASSQKQLGTMYLNGDGVPKDNGRAIQWWTKAADNGNAEAQELLGEVYHNGLAGTAANDAKAVKYMQMAANQGNIGAQLNLSTIYDSSQPSWGVAKDNTQAFYWVKKAAENNQIDSPIQGTLEKAQLGQAQARFNLGSDYSEGIGTVKDENEAVKWWRSAANDGNAMAQAMMATVYDVEQPDYGPTKDSTEAIKWCWKAAEQGLPIAQVKLGNMYHEGDGTVRNDGEAVRWWFAGAKQGNILAETQLASAFFSGEGVTQNYGLAYLWINLSAIQGDADAIKLQDILRKSMQPQAIAQAEQISLNEVVNATSELLAQPSSK